MVHLIDELRTQIYGVIEEFVDEALIVLEDGIMAYMEINKIKTEFDDKIYGKGEQEVLELDAAEKILRKCMVHDIRSSFKSMATEGPDEKNESKFLSYHKNKECNNLSQLNNLAKDVR